MSGVNKVILVGNLGKDPELKYFDGNVAKATFSLATNESYKDKSGNRIEHTEWHNIVFWRSLAETAQKYLKKGMQIYIEGKLQTRQWNDKDGSKKHITEIIGESFTMLQRKESGQTASGADLDSGSNIDLDSKGLPY